MEYKEYPNMDSEKFAELDAQQYHSVDRCCGGEEYFVCIVTPRNDASNMNRGDMLITEKSE